MNATKFKEGDRVVDRDGFRGVVRDVTHFKDVHWYNVRLSSGVAVRYDADLAKIED